MTVTTQHNLLNDAPERSIEILQYSQTQPMLTIQGVADIQGNQCLLSFITYV